SRFTRLKPIRQQHSSRNPVGNGDRSILSPFNGCRSTETGDPLLSINGTASCQTVLSGRHGAIATTGEHEPVSVTNEIDSFVRRMPSLCWGPEHVEHWLTRYVELPGGCLEATKRIAIDGKQLISLSDSKAEKLLVLKSVICHLMQIYYYSLLASSV
ncbi:unnamed protein product, partial [Protopolystoma xenopodis]